MKQPFMHTRLHPSYCDTWNPYTGRDSRTPILDDGVFDLLNHGTPHISPSLFMSGCLDAPEEIPLGATSSIRCVGGWHREEYLRLGREYDDWAGYVRAVAETGAMLSKLMAEIDQDEAE